MKVHLPSENRSDSPKELVSDEVVGLELQNSSSHLKEDS